MKLHSKTLATITAALLATGAFAAETVDATKPAQPPSAQNYYLKGGKYFGSSKTVKDASGKTIIQYFDKGGRMAGYGVPYIGKDSGDRIVKYYDAGGKYLGYSTMTPDPEGGGVTTYKLANGMVFGSSVAKIDKANGDYVTTYYYASGKVAGTSRRSNGAAPQPTAVAAQAKPQQDDTSAAKSTSMPKPAVQSQSTQPAAQTAQKTPTSSTPTAATQTATTAQSSKAQTSVVYSNNGDAPVLVPASSSSKYR